MLIFFIQCIIYSGFLDEVRIFLRCNLFSPKLLIRPGGESCDIAEGPLENWERSTQEQHLSFASLDCIVIQPSLTILSTKRLEIFVKYHTSGVIS